MVVGETLEPEKAEHPLRRRGKPGIGPAGEAREHGALVLLAGQDQVLAHGQLRKDLQQLEGAAHAKPIEIARTHAGHRPAVEMHLARRRLQLSEDAVEQRRLAAAVRTDDAENLAFLDLEGDPVDGDDAAETLLQVAPRGRPGQPVGEAEQARRRERHQDDHQERVAHQVEPFGEAQPFGQQHRDDRTEEGTEEVARAAEDHHQQQIERQAEGERRRVDELHERCVERAGDAAETGAEREGHQRVAPRVDAERQRADRILAQRHEGEAPGGAEQPPGRHRHQRKVRETEIVELPGPVHRPAENHRARNVADPVDAAGEPFLVAEDQIDQRVESERDEGEVVVLHAQRRIAEQPADRKARHAAQHVGGPERPALGGQIGGEISADADEGRLRERDLTGIAERQVEADGGDGHHRPHAEDEDAVRLEAEGRDDEKRGAQREHAAGGEAAARPHTVRSSIRPSSPCGRNSTTTIRIKSGIAIRY